MYGKSLGFRYKKDERRRTGKVAFQAQVACADPRIYIGQGPKTVSLNAGTNNNLTLAGNREVPARILIRGGGQTGAKFTFNNSNGVFSLTYTPNLPVGSVLSINTEARTVLLNYNTNVRSSCTISGTWSGLTPGMNLIVHGGGSLKHDYVYQEAYR